MTVRRTSYRRQRAAWNVPLSRGPFWLLAVAWLCLGSLSARALTEYEVKAAFLFNFAKFIDWPPRAFAEASSPIIFGILGEDPFGAPMMSKISQETVKGRSIKIQRFQPGDDFTGCHLLFISRSAAGQVKDLLERAKGRSMLTVSETEDFITDGGMVNFVMVDRSVRFDINAKAVQTAGLKVSSKLLAVARAVQE